MKKRTLATLILVIVSILAVIAGCGGSDNNGSTGNGTSTDGKTKSYLFVQNASSGSFVGDGSGNYTLTLNGIAPQTIFFTDRPVRDAGQVPMQQFLNSSCFANGGPNAAIDVMGGGEENDVLIVELSTPVYDAQSAILRYTARIIPDTNHSVESFNARRDASIPESFGFAALFIDGCPTGTYNCGDKDGHKAGTVKCCTCWHWGCNFRSDCCSFERCQGSCTDKYGSENKYIEKYCWKGNVWIDNAEDWANFNCPPM